MLHFSPNYFFAARSRKTKAYKPLQSLGSLPVPSVHQMLHQCNVNNLEILREMDDERVHLICTHP